MAPAAPAPPATRTTSAIIAIIAITANTTNTANTANTAIAATGAAARAVAVVVHPVGSPEPLQPSSLHLSRDPKGDHVAEIEGRHGHPRVLQRPVGGRGVALHDAQVVVGFPRDGPPRVPARPERRAVAQPVAEAGRVERLRRPTDHAAVLGDLVLRPPAPPPAQHQHLDGGDAHHREAGAEDGAVRQATVQAAAPALVGARAAAAESAAGGHG